MVTLELLETVFKNKFDYIVIFCPTFHENKTYQRRWLNDPQVLIAWPGDLNEMLKIYTNAFKGRATLFLIDKCANEKSTKIKSCELTRLAFSGRHLGISVWFITQKYNAVIKDFRDNIRHLVLFYEKDEDSLKSALSENNVVPKDLRKQVIESLKSNNKTKLLLRLEHPYGYCILH